MKKLLGLILPIFVFSCGDKADKEVSLPKLKAPSLEKQINRITPLLLWCDGQSASPRKNNLDGRPMCDVGDAMSESGRLLLDGGTSWVPSVWDGVKASIEPSGRPWRAPSYVGKDTSNELSRDQFIGLMEGTVATGNTEPLTRVRAWIKANGNKLCLNPTDGRCDMTPSMWVLSSYVLGENVTGVELAIDEAAINAEAISVPLTYQAYLVMRKIMLLMRLDRLTAAHANAAKIMFKRMPDNLFAQTVYFMSHNGKETDFAVIAEKLAACMEKWEKPGREWNWNKGNVSCVPGTMGHEMVAHGRFLLNLNFRPTGEVALK